MEQCTSAVLFKYINTLMLKQNGCHFPDNIFKYIFLNENVWISLKISLKFVSKVQINKIPALVQIMAWGQPGAKSLSEPMMLSLLMHICVTRPQWVNILRPDDTHWWTGSSLVQVMACHLFSTKPLLNSLDPGKFEWYCRYLIFHIISVIDGWGISCELAFR